MAKYFNKDKKQRFAKLLDIDWEIKKPIDKDGIEKSIDKQWVSVIPACPLEDIFKDASIKYSENKCQKGNHIKLYYNYAPDDILKMHPIADHMAYLAYFSESSFLLNDKSERIIILSKKEIKYFSSILQTSIGDNHDPKMQGIMIDYHNAIDTELYKFVRDIIEFDKEIMPITVGFVSSRMAEEIKKLTNISVYGYRIVLTSDDVRHIWKRHGINGKADQSMSDIADIARLGYVLMEYDEIEWDGGYSKLYKTKDGNKAPQITIKKRIDGTYYVINVVSDSQKKRNVISSLRLIKASN